MKRRTRRAAIVDQFWNYGGGQIWLGQMEADQDGAAIIYDFNYGLHIFLKFCRLILPINSECTLRGLVKNPPFVAMLPTVGKLQTHY